jgi:hypothetical protein
MGSYYGNVTLHGPQQAAVATYLDREGRAAYVSPTVGQATVIYDAVEGDTALAAALSRAFTCPVLVVRNHDSDILQYELYDAGARTDAYDSWPGYFEEDEDDDAPVVPSGGDPLRLCAAFPAAGALGAVAASRCLPTIATATSAKRLAFPPSPWASAIAPSTRARYRRGWSVRPCGRPAKRAACS